MNRVQKAIFPAFIVSSTLLVMMTQLIANPQFTVLANSEPQAPEPVVESVHQEQPETEPVSDESQPAAEQPAAEVANTTCSLGEGFPGSVRQWCELIQSNAAAHNIDPNLVAAVMVQESGGNPNAYSKSGAVGLMQVMPRDGLAASFMCQRGPCFANRPSSQELYEPAFNIEYGTRMLAGLIERNGSIREGLRSYGPMDVGYYYADLVIDIYNSYR